MLTMLVGCAPKSSTVAPEPAPVVAVTQPPTPAPEPAEDTPPEPPPQCAPLAGPSERNEPDFQPIRELIREALAETNGASIAVAVGRDGKIIWEEGFGYADRKRRKKATPFTMYSLASISKPFTSTGLMVLVQRGEVDLEAPINDYLGDTKLEGREGDADQATVRRVAEHTAGLPLHYQFYFDDVSHEPPSRDVTIERYGKLVTVPGERYFYSNLGYGILDHVIARVSGKTYSDFMEDEVFAPLGLTHTSVGLSKADRKRMAVRYMVGGQPHPDYGFDHDGASAVWSSAHDLVRFGMFHIGGPIQGQTAILDKAHREMMIATRPPSEGYGLGWGRSRADGLTVIAHTGGMPGVMTLLRLIPEEDVAIAVLLNSRALPNMHRLVANEIVRALELPARADALCGLDDDHALFGTWAGPLKTLTGERSFEVEVRPTGEVVARIDGEAFQVRGLRWKQGTLSGGFRAKLNAEQSDGKAEPVRLELKLRGDGLDGSLTSMARPGARSHFVQLRASPTSE